MEQQHDTDLDPRSEEERLAAEREAELARRVRREVRRVQRGDYDEQMRREEAEEEEQRREEQAEQERQEARKRNPLLGFITGGILRQEWLKSHYRYPLIIAAVFLLSIVVMFWSLKTDMTYTRTEDEVQLLRERAVRLREEASRLSSHSAIVRQVEQRGLKLQDPKHPNQQID